MTTIFLGFCATVLGWLTTRFLPPLANQGSEVGLVLHPVSAQNPICAVVMWVVWAFCGKEFVWLVYNSNTVNTRQTRASVRALQELVAQENEAQALDRLDPPVQVVLLPSP